MKWQSAELAEITHLVTKGTTPTTMGRQFTDSGINYIKAEALNGDSNLDSQSFAFIDEETHEVLKRSKVEENDVLVTIAGAQVGKCGFVRPEHVPANTNQAVGIIRVDKQKAHPRFVYYFFKLPSTFAMCQSLGAAQAAQPNVTLTALRGFELPLPKRDEQDKIADILSTYDDLMENNRRRMELLEESARLLYREWFVRLRFPGHEHARITNGIPQGWAKKSLESVCTEGDGIQTGPFGSQLHQSDYTEEGVPVVMPTNIIGFRISMEGIARIPEGLADKLGRHRMIPGDTVYGRRGDIGRRAFISRRHAGWFCGTGCLRIRPNPKEINPRYLFDTLGSPETAGTIANRAKGATMPNLNGRVLKSVPVLVAPRSLQDIYAEQVEPMADMIETLAVQNQKLRAARDLLLPRLMSGGITL